jgi:phage baseplate assembly protein W
MAASNGTRPAHLGVGLAFPLAPDARGGLATAAYEEDVRQSIRIILGTNPGERVMRPDFGAGLRDFVFESIEATTMHRVQTRVQEALIDWEPRIDVLQVEVTTDAAVRNRLLIEITYRVRASNSLTNLVYPFYLGEGEKS